MLYGLETKSPNYIKREIFFGQKEFIVALSPDIFRKPKGLAAVESQVVATRLRQGWAEARDFLRSQGGRLPVVEHGENDPVTDPIRLYSAARNQVLLDDLVSVAGHTRRGRIHYIAGGEEQAPVEIPRDTPLIHAISTTAAEIIIKSPELVHAFEEKRRQKKASITLPGPEGEEITGTPGIIVKDPARAEAALMAAAKVFALSDSAVQPNERILARLQLAQQKRATEMAARLVDPKTKEAAKREAIPYLRKASKRYEEMKTQGQWPEPIAVFPNP